MTEHVGNVPCDGFLWVGVVIRLLRLYNLRESAKGVARKNYRID